MKRVILCLLTLCLLAGFITTISGEAKAAEALVHSHCVCGGTANGVGDHICTQSETWTPWDGTTALADGGHYYLHDADGDGVIKLASTVKINGIRVSLCLNGVELTSNQRVFLLNETGGIKKEAGLSICDCTGTGSISSTYTGVAPVIHSYTNARANLQIDLYGGNLVAKDNDMTVVNTAAGVFRLGNNTKSSGDPSNHMGIFNMYGGSISGGMTTSDGGNLYISVDCCFNMYGGVIMGGQTARNGGNVFVAGHMNMHGGRITGGSAGGLGGGIYLSDDAKMGSTVTLGGTAQIIDNAKSNLYLPEGKTVNVGALAKPACIGVTPVTATNFASNVSQSDAPYFFSDDGKYEVIASDGVLKLGSHAHCVCGGSVAGHNCANMGWTSLRAALAAKGMTANTADFGKLAAGKYFLDCDITVTGSSSITKDISLCLNGHSISREEGKTFGYLKNGYTLNICDCSGELVDGVWEFDGSVNGGVNTYGSVIYTHYGSTLNIYGGNFTGKGEKGGVIVVANDGTGDLNQDGEENAADKNAAEPSVLHFYNGVILGSQIATENSTISIYHTAEVYWHGGKIIGGKIADKANVAVICQEDRLLRGSYSNINTALSKCADGQFVRMIGDSTDAVTVTGGYLDLNGHKVSGVTVKGTLYTFDTMGGVGRLQASAASGGSIPTGYTSELTGQIISASYPDGMAFYGVSARISKISIAPDVAGMGYRAEYHVPEIIADQLESYGYQVWREGKPVYTCTSKKPFVSGMELTLRVKNVLETGNDFLANWENADTRVYARAFICMKGGATLYSKQLLEMVEMADGHYNTLTTAQKTALQNMYNRYEDLIVGWDMPNTIHAEGWTNVGQSQFEALLSKSGDDYVVTPGKYTLVENVNLGDKTLKVNSDKEVTICLNGYTISGTQRLFKVYGNLNICDCHPQGWEGTLTSSLAGEGSVYAPIAYIYPGTMNVYGGNLVSTGKVNYGGAIAVGSGTYHGVKKTPGKLNLMGGRISGGQVYENGGLIWVLDSASMYMYDGQLVNSSADGHGGAVSAGSDSKLMLYGGKISDCSAENYGGGVYTALAENLLYLGNKLTVSNNAALVGGNVYHNGKNTLTIHGSVITDGKAQEYGGGLYIATADVQLSGDAVIRNNENGSLYLQACNGINTQELTLDSDVHLYNVSSMPLNADLRYITLERDEYHAAQVGGQQVLIPKTFAIPTQVEGFQAGFGRVDITPTQTGLPLAGYGNSSSRLSTTTAVNVYDELKVSCTAITDEAGETVLILGVDLIRPDPGLMSRILPAVTAVTGVPESHIFTNFTHTHSVPETKSTTHPKIRQYNAMLPDRFAQAASEAMADREAATMQTGSLEVDGLNFVRHYVYEENGETKYAGDNFGVVPTNNDTLRHVTEADHTMHLVKFVRKGTDILLANWRVHPHMTGGGTKTYVSSDIIGTTRYHLEKECNQLADLVSNEDYRMHFMYLQGAAGNINETSKINSEKHGLTYYKYGQNLANQIFKVVWNKTNMKDTETGLWQVDNFQYNAIADVPTQQEYEHAKNASDRFNAWLAENPNATSAEKKAYCEELGYLTWFHFNNVINRHSFEDQQIPLNTFSLGKHLAFFTAPGELWDTVSMEIEAASPYDMTLCIGYSQDHFNYFVYDPENGGQPVYESYESNNYRFVAPNTINDMIAYWKQALDRLYNNLEDAT